MGSVFRVVNPTSEPLTLAEAKAHLRVDGTAEDTYITSLIVVARMAAEDRLQRTLLSTTWKLVEHTFPLASRRLPLPMGSVLSIESVVYVDANGDEQTMPEADYQLSLGSPVESVALAPAAVWPSTQADRADAVEVTYVAGVAANAAGVPAPVRHWLLLALADLYEQRNRSAEKPIVPQKFADSLLDVYRVIGI